jgi:hypothetical protein
MIGRDAQGPEIPSSPLYVISMPSTEELDRSLLHLRLESFISARWGLTASVRPRAQLSYFCQAAGDVARPTLDELSGCVWVAYGDQRSPRAVGLRLRVGSGGAPRYEILEWTPPYEVRRSLWRFQRGSGWTRIHPTSAKAP